MPKKKKSKYKKVLTTQDHGIIDVINKEQKANEDAYQEMKKEMLEEQPETREMLRFMEKFAEGSVKQAQDSSLVFTNCRGLVTPELLSQFPDSPTARDTLVALNHYTFAFNILLSYPKQRALLETDCDFIQPGLHHFIEGNMIAQYMVKQFPLFPSFSDLVEDYLQLRPNDILVEYIHVKTSVSLKTRKLPDYERCKETIRAFEMFVHKLLPYKREETARRILIDALYMLGANYTSTFQDLRALDAFEKCYALDETNIGALYSIAFLYMENDPDKALKLCNKYLDMTPKCDEKFPNIHYVMGFIYAYHFKDTKLAKKYYYLGKEAETFRLPFNPPTDFPPKSFLASIIPLAESNK